MGNQYFKFKQFIIHQNEDVFKVNTDGVLLAAWVRLTSPRRILEIGCGTGVLSFMMAQKYPGAKIIGIDILPAAIEICDINIQVNESRFSNLEFILADIREWSCEEKFDSILSNPPFFEDNSLSNSEVEKIAKHSTALNRREWCSVVSMYLTDEGNAFVIYPFDGTGLLEIEFANAGLYMVEKCLVKPNEYKPVHRVMYKLSKQSPQSVIESELAIRDGDGYSAEYKRLTGDFYL